MNGQSLVAAASSNEASGDSCARSDIRRAIDRAYRELVEGSSADDLMRDLCRGLAEALTVPMVALVQRQEGGILRLQAASGENLLWAEFARLPERCDGTITGDGPSARALRDAEPHSVPISDEGFMPWREAARREGITHACACPLETADHSWVLLLLSSTSEQDAIQALMSEASHAAVGLARLIQACERIAMDRTLSAAMHHSGNAAFIADARGDIVWCNTAFCRLTGYTRQEIVGRNPRFLSSGQHGTRHYRELWNTIQTGKVWHGETVDRDQAGEAFTAIQTISPFGEDGRVTHYLAIYEDISHQKADQLLRDIFSVRDPLTGLMHQAALENRLSSHLGDKKTTRIAIVCVAGIASIKALGEEASEGLLSEMQLRISRIAGADRAARIALGEYLIWLPDELEEAQRMKHFLGEELMESYPIIGEVPGIDLQIGCASAPEDGNSLVALKKHADRAVGIEPLEPARRRDADGT